MDENSGSRFGRSIWTVWGYLSGAVARYLRPEVTDEGNQNASSKSDETELKSTTNKVSGELKSNNSEKEENEQSKNDKSTGEIKCSLPEVRSQVASVQWENTDVVKDDSNVELHVDNTKKQTYHFAVWSAGADNEGNISGDTDSNAHVEKETVSQSYVDSECKESESPEEPGETGQKYGDDEKKEGSDKNYEDEKCALKEVDSGNADMMVQTGFGGQGVEEEQQVVHLEGFGDFKDVNEYFLDETEKAKSEGNQGTKSQVQDLLPQQECHTEETDVFSKPEGLNLEKKSEMAEFSKNEAKEMMLATEQDKERETAQELEEHGRIEQKDSNVEDEECGWDHEDENCAIMKEDPDNADVMVQKLEVMEKYSDEIAESLRKGVDDTMLAPIQDENTTDSEQDTAKSEFLGSVEELTDHGLKHADECLIDKIGFGQNAREKTENEEDQDPESQVQDLLPQQGCNTEEADDISRPERIKVIAEFSKNEVEMLLATKEDKESETEQELEETGQSEQKDGNVEDEEYDGNHEDEKSAMKNEDPDNADVIFQKLNVMEKYSDEIAESLKKGVDDTMLVPIQDENTNEQDTAKSEFLGSVEELRDQGETEAITGCKHAAECLIDKKEENVVDQNAQEKTENEEDQDPESQVQDLLPQQEYNTEEADDFSRPKKIKVVEKYSDEIAEVSKNEVEMILATEEDKESETKQELEETGQPEEEDEEYDGNHDDEKCAMKNEDPDNTDVIFQKLNIMEKYSDEIAESLKKGVDDTMLVPIQDENTSEQDTAKSEFLGSVEELTDHRFEHADKCLIDKKETNVVDQNAQEKTENEEDQDPESQVQDLLPQQGCSTEEADDLSRPERIKVVEKYSDEIAEVSKNEVEMILATEEDKESETEQELEETGQPEEKDGNVEDEEYDGSHEDEKCAMKNEDPDNIDVIFQKLKIMEKCSDEIAESLKKGVDDTMLAPIQDENTIDSEQNAAKSEFLGSVETPQRSCVPKDETELKLTKAVDEILSTKQDAPDNTPETGTGSPVVAIKTEDLISDVIVHEFPGELRKETEMASDLGHFKEIKTDLHDEHLGERHLERETVVARSVEQSQTPKALEEAVEFEQDVETQIKSPGTMEGEVFTRSVELSTEVIDEMMETEISSEDKEAELFETESELSIITNVAVQPHELHEVTEAECKPPQGKTVTFSDSLGNLTVTAKTGHFGEELADAKLILTKSLSPVEFMEETVDLLGESEQCNEGQEILETDLEKAALEFVEKITNQVLQEMIETEINSQETEPSTEEHCDAKYVSVDAFILDKESEMVDNNVEMEVETELYKQNEQTVSSPESECLKQQTTAVLSTGTQNGGRFSGEEHKDVEEETFTSKENQTARLCANSESKESETAEKAGQIEQNDGNDKECDQTVMNREDPDIAAVIIRSQEQQIDVTDHGERKGYADEHLLDEKLKTIVDQKGEEKTEDQELELQAPADAVVLEEERLLSETMEIKVVTEVETINREVKRKDKSIRFPECETTDGRHEPIQKVIVGKAVLSSLEEFMEVGKPGMKRGFDQVSKDRSQVKTGGKSAVHLQAFEDSSLDFTIQKSRIAVKNPLVRPPKDPRKLLSKASVEPLLPKPPPSSQRIQITAPGKGVIGFKLPGLGAGLPVLRKTEFGQKAREGGEAESTLQPQQKSVAVSEDSVTQEASAKPKWTPPRHPGMGGPMMMAELKNKLKKPVNE